jgi:hypothetical protein
MLVGLMSPRLMKSRQRWISATEKRVEATVRNISCIKGLKLMGMEEGAFQEVQQLRANELEMGKYVAGKSIIGCFAEQLGLTVSWIHS